MTSHFIDQFGFNEEEFAEQEEGVNNPFDRISDINFSISANEDNPNSALFEACCNERIQQFNDSNSDEEDMWEEKELTYTSTAESRPSNAAAEVGSDQSNDDSSDSEEEESAGPLQIRSAPEKPSPAVAAAVVAPAAVATSPAVSTSSDEPVAKMDVDTTDPWPNNFDDVPMDSAVAMDTTPTAWEQQPVTSSAEEDTGWANFSDFNSGFMNASNEGPRSSSPVAMDSESSPPPASAPATVSNSPSLRPGSAYVVPSESSSSVKATAEGDASVKSSTDNQAKPDADGEDTVSSSPSSDNSNPANTVGDNNVERAMEEEPSRPINAPSSPSPSPVVTEANSNDEASSSPAPVAPEISSSPARQLQAEADSSGTLWNSDSNANPCSPAATTVTTGAEEGNEAAAQSPQQNCADTGSGRHHGLVNDTGPDSPHQEGGVLLTNSSPVDSSSSSSSSPPRVGEFGEDRVSGLLSSNTEAGTKTDSLSCNKTSTINVDLVNEIDRKELKDTHSQDVVRHNEDGGGVNQEEEEDDDNFEAEALDALNQFTSATGQNGPI